MSVIVIPARFQSKRFPGKPLAGINGRPMIEYVYRQAEKARGVEQVIVATDDARIREAVEAFGGKVVMTSPEHRCGSERVAEVARSLDAGIVANLQGDEPLIHPRAIEQAIEPLEKDASVRMATLMTRITDNRELESPHVVKVVVDGQGFALYFSRSLVPYRPGQNSQPVYKHIGLYVFRRDFLLDYAEMEPTALEKKEKLEQLRVLENGYRIKVVETGYASIGVNTPEQLEQVARQLESES